MSETLNAALPIGLAFVLGAAFSSFRLMRRYGSRMHYAVRSTLGKLLILSLALCSMLVFVCINSCGIRLLPPVAPASVNSIVLAVAAAGLSVGIFSIAPMKKRGIADSEVIVSVASWVNDIIEREVDRLVTQHVTEIALAIQNGGVTIQCLQNLGNHLIQQKYAIEVKKRNVELARIDDFAQEQNFAGLISYLMVYCDPAWLETTAMQAMQHLRAPETTPLISPQLAPRSSSRRPS